jgi:transposase
MNQSVSEQVKYLREIKHLSFRQIGETLSLKRKTVSRAYYKSSAKTHRKKSPLNMDIYHELIAQWFNEQSDLKAIQVWQRLKERGVIVGRRTVSRYTQHLRNKKQKIHYPLNFLPGEEAQVDWFFANHPILGKLCGFVMILSYSRFAFFCFFPRNSFEFFIEGHLQAFAFFKGFPRCLRYDNLSSVVLKRQPLTYNPSFLAFARAHDFEIYLCNVACGNEKGRVERLIRTIRETCMNTLNPCSTFSTLNKGALEWLENRNNTLHRTTGKTPASMFADEQLKSIAPEPWLNERVLPPKQMSKTGLVTFDNNHYSAPDYLINETLTIHATPEYVYIFDARGEKKASHPRSFKTNQTFINPAHRSFKQISSEAKRKRIFAVIQNLDPWVKSFLEESVKSGEDPYTNAYLIFKLLPGHARETILSAIRQVFSQKQYSIQSLYRLLKRSPDSEPVQPKNLSLLDIDYKPRSLEEYQ